MVLLFFCFPTNQPGATFIIAGGNPTPQLLMTALEVRLIYCRQTEVSPQTTVGQWNIINCYSEVFPKSCWDNGTSLLVRIMNLCKNRQIHVHYVNSGYTAEYGFHNIIFIYPYPKTKENKIQNNIKPTIKLNYNM